MVINPAKGRRGQKQTNKKTATLKARLCHKESKLQQLGLGVLIWYTTPNGSARESFLYFKECPEELSGFTEWPTRCSLFLQHASSLFVWQVAPRSRWSKDQWPEGNLAFLWLNACLLASGELLMNAGVTMAKALRSL